MSNKAVIHTNNAPAAIGPYAQAVKAGGTVYLSGQIPLDPATMELVGEDFAEQAEQVFRNLAAVCQAAGGSLGDLVKLNIYLTDLSRFAVINDVMTHHLDEPFPARAAIGVSELPRGAQVEMDGIMVIPPGAA